jgi:hypothetical protein
MIQRIQTLYLFLAFVVTGILFLFPLEHERWKRIFFYAKSVLYHTFGFKHDALELVSIKKRQINLSWQIEHDFKFNFIGIVCLSFTKHIWRNSSCF